MKVGVIGAGRLGICFALLLENAGYEVVASDVREDYVKSLQEKKIEKKIKNAGEKYIHESDDICRRAWHTAETHN